LAGGPRGRNVIKASTLTRVKKHGEGLEAQRPGHGPVAVYLENRSLKETESFKNGTTNGLTVPRTRGVRPKKKLRGLGLAWGEQKPSPSRKKRRGPKEKKKKKKRVEKSVKGSINRCNAWTKRRHRLWWGRTERKKGKNTGRGKKGS